MAEIARPASMREMVDQLWFAIIGSNGDGIASQVRVTREKVAAIEATLPTLWSRADHEKAEAIYAERDKAKEEARAAGNKEKAECKERRKMSRRDWLMVALTGLSSLGTVAAVIVAILALKGGS